MKALLNGKLAKAMLGALGLNVIEAGLGFLTAVVLGRMMGAENYGVYSYAMAIAGILAIICLLGQDKFSVREVAKLHAHKQYAAISEHVLATQSKVGLLALIIVGLVCTGLTFLPLPFSDDKYLTIIIALAVFIVSALIKLYIAFFQGIQQVITALYPDKLIRPLSFFCIIFLLSILSPNNIDASWVITANVIAALFALLILRYLWSRNTSNYEEASFAKKQLLSGWKPALPFALLAGISVINSNVDVLMLGFFVSDADIGVYRISTRIAALVAFALAAVNSVFGPNISALYAKADFAQLQNNASKAALAALALALPCFLVLSLAGHWVLLLFGEEFTKGTDILAILSLGQFGNALAGSVALLLMMTKHAKKAANSLFISVLLNVALNSVLIPLYGVLGAAIATSSSMILLNAVNVYWVWRYLKINSTVSGFLIKRY